MRSVKHGMIADFDLRFLTERCKLYVLERLELSRMIGAICPVLIAVRYQGPSNDS